MTTETPSIVWFDQIGKDDVPLVGGKGANLGEMTRAQIPVPPGFVVSTADYRAFLAHDGLRERLTAILADLDIDDPDRLQATAQAARAAILATPVPEHIADEIRQAYQRLGEGAVAVRSSATAEDLAEASFAGQQDTYLNIEGADNVVAAVQRCWASLFEARAIFYRAHVGWDHLSVDLAVPVQRMVQAHVSGVMFTVEPIESDTSKIVIEAVYGLGEAAVSGEINPDHYVVEKASMVLLDTDCAPQDRQIVRDPAGISDGDGNTWLPVPEALRETPKLTPAQIRQLAQIGLRVEQHYGRPQDIEWALSEGEFYLLQTRPVTTLAAAPLATAPAPSAEGAAILSGAPASPGVGVGPVRRVLDPAQAGDLQPGEILVAEMTTPDFVPAMKRASAIVTERGGRTCHAAIISRELGVPCVVGADGATTQLRDDQVVTVDGSRGQVHDGREDALLAWWADRETVQAGPRLKTRTQVYVNLAQPDLAERVAAQDVDGVGLLRAEFIIAQIGEHPRSFLRSNREEEFIAALEGGLRQIAAAFDPRPVIYRATDFKTNEYANLKGGAEFEPVEENPMIGYRGAVRYVREPDLFAMEMAALKRVRRDHPNLSLMIPFVRTTAELEAVLALVRQNGLERGPDFKVWMMVEVPSNIFLLDEFIDAGIDGISIGSNDLTQLILGIDRDSERFVDEFDERNPAVLKALEHAVTTARRRGITVSICGQGPSEHADLTQRLVGWGITSISVTPDRIDQTRALVAEAEAAAERGSTT